LLRNVSSSQKPLVLISSSQLRSKSELSPSAFVDFCILLGTDASPRIPGVGPKRAFTLIKEHGSIENILQQEKYRTKVDMEGFMTMVGNAREVFGKAPPIPDGVSLEQGVYDEVEVEAWLRDTHGVMFVEQEQVGDVDQAWEVDSTGETLRPSGELKEWDESWDQAILDRESKEPSSPR
jgi:flap endonuclease-1